MSNRRYQTLIRINQISDMVVIPLAFWMAHVVRAILGRYFLHDLSLDESCRWSLDMVLPFRHCLIAIPLYPFVLALNGFYRRSKQLSAGRTLWLVLKSVTIATLLLIAALYLLRLNQVGRGVIGLFLGFSTSAIYAKDRLFQAYNRRRFQRGRFSRAVMLVGMDADNTEFESLLNHHPEWGLCVKAKLHPTPESLCQLPSILHGNPISCVIFNVPHAHFGEVQDMIQACETEGVEAWLVANFVKTSIARATVADFYGKPILVFRTTPDVSWQLTAKRVLDVLGATVGLLIAGPLILLPVAMAIKLTSAGPILFRQRRSGLHGRPFTMLKFRSMVDNAEMLRAELDPFNETTGPVFKMKTDPRVTPIGRYLRHTSLDELPQLWNVLMGDMSLVGPRPPIPSEVEKYDSWHRRRLSVKPGMTCLWQISGRSGIGFDQWIKLDLEYIDHWSIWLDLRILFKTLPVVLRGAGAH